MKFERRKPLLDVIKEKINEDPTIERVILTHCETRRLRAENDFKGKVIKVLRKPKLDIMSAFCDPCRCDPHMDMDTVEIICN